MANVSNAVGNRFVASLARPAQYDLWAVASKCERPEAEMRELARLQREAVASETPRLSVWA